MPVAKSPEFRRRALELVDQGEPVAQVAKNLGISESCLRRGRREEEIDAGVVEGLTSDERAESWPSCGVRTGCWRWKSRS